MAPLVVVGLSHKTTPVEVRERIAFSPARQESAYEALLRQVREAAILSTCCRTEVYAVVDEVASGAHGVIDFLGLFHGLHPEALAPYLYRQEGAEAASHLFAVAAGLDSMVLGEPQILGQIRTAHERAVTYHGAGPVLSWVFNHALKVGKQVRSDTGIGRNAVSVSSAAVELARELLGGLAGRSLLVVGAGKMGELTAKALRAWGVSNLVVTNRTHSRALELAERVGGRAARFEQLPSLLVQADLVVTSTDSPGFILTRSLVGEAMSLRHHRPLFLIDIAVPRDVDPSVQEVEGVFLHNLDALKEVCLANLEERRKEVGNVQRIIDVEVAAFRAWVESRGVVPTIAALRGQAEEIRQAELRKALTRMGELSEQQKSTLEALTSGIVNKMLHQPTVKLKEESGEGKGSESAAILRRLFGLEEDG